MWAASKCASEMRLLTGPHQMSPDDEGSSTMNLSLGERPVYSPVRVTKPPPSASSPSPRLSACS